MAMSPFSARRTHQPGLLMIDVLGFWRGNGLQREAVQQGCFHLGSSFVLHMRKHVRVGVQSEGSARVSKLLGHHLGCNPNRESKSGRCVAEIVEPDVRQTRFPQEWFEILFNQVPFVDGFATRGGKDQISEY